MQKLLRLVDELETYIPMFEHNKDSISDVNIGWHIEHACLVIIKITDTIKQSNPADYKSKFSFAKWFVFLTEKFPRGRAQAPNSVLPNEKIDPIHLIESIKKVKQAISALKECQKNQYFKHPIFGNLKVSKTLHFLAIHTKHHIRIIQDILK
jgi:hypothetical protein